MEGFYELKNVWEKAGQSEKTGIMSFSEGYKDFLNNGKTERECVTYAVNAARMAGFKELSEYKALKPGDKVYAVNRGKSMLLCVVGRQPMESGVNIVAAHIDSPRLDLKPVPIFEDGGLAFFKTHYYGGIKKYQWTAMPIAIHGVVVTEKGAVTVTLGEKCGEPALTVTDLLPHLATEQMQKKMSEGIEGEKLNLLAGSIPEGGEKDKIKANILKIIFENYGIREEDFISAEMEAVPAFPARDIGLDRSMVGAYGQDDRVCAYAALKAVLDAESPERGAICLLVDKEEVGSMGNTGMKSRFFEYTLSELMGKEGGFAQLKLNRCLSSSACLSADVCAGYDPNYDNVYEKRNTPYLGCGVVLTKYTGSRGKAGSSEASAEFTGFVRRLFDDNGVFWQTGELGKVDVGGGGTVAQFLANLNIDVIDCGVALLSMHSPFEVASKADIYMAYKGYLQFLLAKRLNSYK